ncbi:MAG: ATP-binding protein [Clostridiales bacterium]|nr:ATP-binding protein [Clostridiales bacterium]
MSHGEALRALLQEYAQLREANERERQNRLAAVGMLDPEIPAILERTAALFRSQARGYLSSPGGLEQSIADARARAAALSDDLARRLAALGLPNDHLMPIYRCADCRDTGFVGDPIKTQCACLRRRVLERAFEGAGRGAENADQRFEAFDPTVFPDELQAGQPMSQRQFMAHVAALCEKYADELPRTDKLNVVLMGASGLGKTYLLGCVARRAMDRGRAAVRVTAYQMLEAMRGQHMGDEGGRRAFRDMLDCELLLLDDLGTEPMLQNVTREYLFALLNERLAARRHTMVATNLGVNDLRERYGERVLSRLMDARNAHAIKLFGRDVRLFVGRGDAT